MNKIYKCYPGGTFKVLTMSYDDGKLPDERLVNIFNTYGIRGTFNLNSGCSDDPNRLPASRWPSLYKGHEIAVHTRTHPTISRSPDVEIIREILEDRDALEQICGYPVRGMAYPNGANDARVASIAKACGMEYARLASDRFVAVESAVHIEREAEGPILIGDTTGFELPDDYMHWLPTCHHNHHLVENGRRFLALHKKQYLNMMYVWGHSFEFDQCGNWDVIEDFCRLMGGRDDIWYATNIEIVDYDTVFSRLQFTADLTRVHNPSAASAWIAVNDNKIVEVKGGETLKL